MNVVRNVWWLFLVWPACWIWLFVAVGRPYLRQRAEARTLAPVRPVTQTTPLITLRPTIDARPTRPAAAVRK